MGLEFLKAQSSFSKERVVSECQGKCGFCRQKRGDLKKTGRALNE